jgi:hypothetical protein
VRKLGKIFCGLTEYVVEYIGKDEQKETGVRKED